MDIIIVKEALCWTDERTTRGAPPFGARLLIMYQILTDYFIVFYVDMNWANSLMILAILRQSVSVKL